MKRNERSFQLNIIEVMFVYVLVLFVAAFATMIVEIAFNTGQNVSSTRSYNLQVAGMGATIAVAGMSISMLFQANLLHCAAFWVLAPPFFWAVKRMASCKNCVDLFHNIGSRCGESIGKTFSRASQYMGRKTERRSVQMDAQAAIAMLEKDLLARSKDDDNLTAA